MSPVQIDVVLLAVVTLAAMYAGCWLVDVVANRLGRRRARLTAARPGPVSPALRLAADLQRQTLENVLHGAERAPRPPWAVQEPRTPRYHRCPTGGRS